MKIIINALETIDTKIFEELQEYAQKTAPFQVEITFGERFAFRQDKKLELDELDSDTDILHIEHIDDYDCIEHFGRNFINLSKITKKYEKENSTRIFYADTPFYHNAILPIPFVYAGRKLELIDDKCTQIFEMNGTVDFAKDHILVCGTNFPTSENYSVMFHELFHLLHDKIHGTYANGKQTAHCTNLTDNERCIMNPPNRVFYSTDEKTKREKLGTKFCENCTNTLINLNHNTSQLTTPQH